MIRVICIDGKSRLPRGIDLPEGEVMTAYQSDSHDDGYKIEGYECDKDGHPVSHRKVRFLPTSDIDEFEEVDKLRRFLESDFYERFFNPLNKQK